MKQPKRLLDHRPPGLEDAVDLLGSARDIEVPPYASARVWARLQSESESKRRRWMLPAALAAAVALIVVSQLLPSSERQVRARGIRLADRPIVDVIKEGDRLVCTHDCILRVADWGELALGPSSELEVVSVDPLQFILHSGETFVMGRSEQTLTLLAGRTRAEIRWGFLQLWADGRMSMREQEGDFDVKDGVQNRRVAQRPSQGLQRRQQQESYRLGEHFLLKNELSLDELNEPQPQGSSGSPGEPDAAHAKLHKETADPKIDAQADATSPNPRAGHRPTADSEAKSGPKSTANSEAKSAENSAPKSKANSEAKSAESSAPKSKTNSAENPHSEAGLKPSGNPDSEPHSEAAPGSAAKALSDSKPLDGPRQWYLAARATRDPRLALQLFDKVAATDNPWAEVATHQAIRNLMRRRIWMEAAARIAKARERFASGSLQPELHLDAIECALALGNLKNARREAQNFVNRYPDHPRVEEMRQHSKEL